MQKTESGADALISTYIVFYQQTMRREAFIENLERVRERKERDGGSADRAFVSTTFFARNRKEDETRVRKEEVSHCTKNHRSVLVSLSSSLPIEFEKRVPREGNGSCKLFQHYKYSLSFARLIGSFNSIASIKILRDHITQNFLIPEVPFVIISMRLQEVLLSHHFSSNSNSKIKFLIRKTINSWDESLFGGNSQF